MKNKIIYSVEKLTLLLSSILVFTTAQTKAQSPCAGQAQFGFSYITCSGFCSGNATNYVSGNTYSWNFGDGTITPFSSNTNFSHTYTTSSTYTVQLISHNSGNNCYDSFTQSIAVNITLKGAFSYTIHGDTVHLTNNSTGIFNTTVWAIDNGIQNYYTNNATAIFYTGGLHSAYLMVQNGTCYDTLTQYFNITIPNADTLSGTVFNDTNNNGVKDAGETGFPNQLVHIDLNNGFQTYVYSDVNGNYSIPVAPSVDSVYIAAPYGYIQTTPLLQNYYHVNGTGNQHIANLNFGLYMSPCVAIQSAYGTLQSGSTYNFNGYASVVSGSIVYLWFFGDGTIATWNSSAATTHTYTSNGTYYPKMLVYANGCQDSFMVAPITITGLSGSPCAGQSQFTYNANGCGGNYYFYASNYVANNTYTWHYGDGTTGSGWTSNHTYTNSGNDTAQLISYNAANSCYDTTTQIIVVNTTLKAAFNYTMSGDTVHLTNTSFGTPTSYNWYYDDNTSDNIANPSHQFLTAGMHLVTLQIQNAASCFDSISHYINVVLPIADTLRGNVFNDANANGIHDAGEFGIPNQWVLFYLNGNPLYQHTDASGNYSLVVAPSTDSIFAYNNLGGYNQTLPINTNHYSVIVTGNQTISGLDFGFQDTSSIISGHVFFDNNGNSIQDAGEANGSNIRVDLYGNSLSQHVWTDWNGNYAAVMYHGNGNFNITCNPLLSNLIGYNITTAPTQYNVSTSNANIYPNNDFGVHAINATSGNNLMINITPASTVVPGIGGYYYVTVKNIGSTTLSGNAIFNYDSQLTYSSSTLGTNNSAAHQISWAVGSLAPNAYITNHIWMNLPSTVALGTVLQHNAIITLSSGTDVDTANNNTNYSQVVVGSYDPNVKTVSPVGEGTNGAINPNNAKELTYTINFQNTGTAPAVNIVVKDVIDADLDLNTLQMLESSNNNTLLIDSATRMATWKFQNIMLPDSNHDEPHSHGYLQYKIKLKNGLSQSTAINNTANIYFDFNTAVVTNTTVNTIDYALGVNDVVDGNLSTISVAPNPMNQFATIRIDGLKGSTDVDLIITNILGEKVKTLSHQTNIISINRNDLSSGIYFYELKNNGKKIGNGKIVME